jgi:hypothetical protein
MERKKEIALFIVMTVMLGVGGGRVSPADPAVAVVPSRMEELFGRLAAEPEVSIATPVASITEGALPVLLGSRRCPSEEVKPSIGLTKETYYREDHITQPKKGEWSWRGCFARACSGLSRVGSFESVFGNLPDRLFGRAPVSAEYAHGEKGTLCADYNKALRKAWRESRTLEFYTDPVANMLGYSVEPSYLRAGYNFTRLELLPAAVGIGYAAAECLYPLSTYTLKLGTNMFVRQFQPEVTLVETLCRIADSELIPVTTVLSSAKVYHDLRTNRILNCLMLEQPEELLLTTNGDVVRRGRGTIQDLRGRLILGPVRLVSDQKWSPVD